MEAQNNLEGRTAPTMPVVRVADLSKSRGERVQLTFFDSLSGAPIMGSRNLEGKGESLLQSSQEIMINQAAKVVNAGDEMSQQRVLYELLPLAKSQLEGWYPRYYNQSALVHMWGGRGTMRGRDWIIPLASASDYSEIMINPVLAPSYNRHLVIDGSGFVQGGQQLGSIDSTDVWTLDHIDQLSTMIDELEFPMQYLRLPDDPQAIDAPLKGVLYLTPKQLNQLVTQSSGRNWTDMQKLAWQRASYGIKHPLFMGEPGLYRGILIKQLPDMRYIHRLLPGDTTKIVTAANRYVTNRNTPLTESDQTVNASLTAGHAVDRALFLSGQAMGYVIGRSKANNFYFDLRTRMYNFDLAEEIAGISTFGMEKLRAVFKDGNGNLEPTDHGCLVIDSAVKI